MSSSSSSTGMSSTSSTPSGSASPPIFPTPTTTNNPSPNPPPQSSSLYLFTFLATLLLLLAVSCAIVIRSFILRRRFRRRIEEAIAAGVLIPGALDDGPGGGGMGRGRRRDFGEKPKLWEVWVDEHGQVHETTQESGSEGDSFGKGEGRWEEILPVSATILSSNAPKPIPLPMDGSTTSLTAPEHQDARRLFLSRLLGRRAFTTPPTLVQSPPREQNESATELDTTYPSSLTSKDQGNEDERLQVSVLISMPNPNARRAHGSEIGAGSDVSLKGKGKGHGLEDMDGDGEAEIPDVVFGVAEVGFRAGVDYK